MTLRRKAIRLAIVAAIKAAVPEFGEHVYANLAAALREAECPAAVVLGDGEHTIEELSSSPVWHKRVARFTVHVSVSGLEDLEDQADELGQKVEDALWRDEALHARELISSLELVSVTGPTLSGEGSRLFGDLAITWDVTYECDPLADHGPEDDFASVHAEIETHEAREGPEAEAEFEMEVATP